MAETEIARRRRDAARRAMGPQQQEVQDRLADILALTGGVFAGGASYAQLLELIEDYSKRTGQSPQKLLRDTDQLTALFTPSTRRDPIWKERVIQEVFQESGAYKNLPAQDRLRLIQAMRKSIINDTNTPLTEVREISRLFPLIRMKKEIQSLWESREKEMDISSGRVGGVVDYSKFEDNPRLLAYSRDLDYQNPGSGGGKWGSGSYYDSKDAWKKNVDPEFLDKLTFIHWTRSPEPLVKGKGLPSTTGEVEALSAGMYFRDDPSGHGFITNRFMDPPFGLILDGDVTYAGNNDIFSGAGDPGVGAYIRDPILDEQTFENSEMKVRRKLKDRGYSKPISVGGAEDYWSGYHGDINEALIERPRITGLVVDPSRYEDFTNSYTTDASIRKTIVRARILAEEIGVPIYDLAGRPFPMRFQPESVSEEQVRQVARNFPKAEELTGGRNFAKSEDGISLLEQLSIFRELPREISVQDLLETNKLMEAGEGETYRRGLRERIRSEIASEFGLHSGDLSAAYEQDFGHYQRYGALSSMDELADAYKFEVAKSPLPDFDDMFLFGDRMANRLSNLSGSDLVDAVNRLPVESLTASDSEYGRPDPLEELAGRAEQDILDADPVQEKKLQSLLSTIEQMESMPLSDAQKAVVQRKKAELLAEFGDQGLGASEVVEAIEEDIPKLPDEPELPEEPPEPESRIVRDIEDGRPAPQDLFRNPDDRQAFIDFASQPSNRGVPLEELLSEWDASEMAPEVPTAPEQFRSIQRKQPQTPSQVEPGLSEVRMERPEYLPEFSVEKTRTILHGPEGEAKDKLLRWLREWDGESRIPDAYADLSPTPVEVEFPKEPEPLFHQRRRVKNIEEVASVIEDIAADNVDITPEQRQEFLQDEKVKKNWGPKILRALEVAGFTADVVDLGYNIYKHGSRGLEGYGAGLLEGAGFLADLPSAVGRQLPGQELREKAGVDPFGGKGARAISRLAEPARRELERVKRRRQIENYIEEYTQLGEDPDTARRQAIANVRAAAEGRIAQYVPGFMENVPQVNIEDVRKEVKQQEALQDAPFAATPGGMARIAARRALEQQARKKQDERMSLPDIDLGLGEEDGR